MESSPPSRRGKKQERFFSNCLRALIRTKSDGSVKKPPRPRRLAKWPRIRKSHSQHRDRARDLNPRSCVDHRRILNPLAYLTDVLNRLSSKEETDVAPLLPDTWRPLHV